MRRLILTLKTVLAGRKGESLMESLASLFIYVILMMAITVMLKTALNITTAYTEEAKRHQETMVNEAVMERYGANPDTADLILDGGGILVTIPIELFPGDEYEAFRPEGSSE